LTWNASNEVPHYPLIRRLGGRRNQSVCLEKSKFPYDYQQLNHKSTVSMWQLLHQLRYPSPRQLKNVNKWTSKQSVIMF